MYVYNATSGDSQTKNITASLRTAVRHCLHNHLLLSDWAGGCLYVTKNKKYMQVEIKPERPSSVMDEKIGILNDQNKTFAYKIDELRSIEGQIRDHCRKINESSHPFFQPISPNSEAENKSCGYPKPANTGIIDELDAVIGEKGDLFYLMSQVMDDLRVHLDFLYKQI